MFTATEKITCPTCKTRFTVDCGDELPGDNCADPKCGKRLCRECLEGQAFTCECCGGTFCLEHLGLEEQAECSCTQTDADQFNARYCPVHGDYPASPIRICKRCVSAEEQAAPAAIPMPVAVVSNSKQEAA